MTYRKLLGEVRAEMARQGIPQQDLASLSGIPQSTLSKRLRGHSGITLDELLAICDALHVSLAALAARAEQVAA